MSEPSKTVATKGTAQAAAAAPESAAAARVGRAEVGPGYLLWLLVGLLGAVVAFYLVLIALKWNGHLPPPSFSNSLCLDEKLQFLREHPVQSPDLLVIGSSIAWRTFDAEAVAAPPLSRRPLNAGFCGLHVNQSSFVAHWLLDRHASVRDVLVLTAPQDFAECSRKQTVVFNVKDVSDYVDGRVSPWLYFLKYYSPGAMVRNARQIKERRSDREHTDALIFDRFGGGPLDADWTRPTLLYGALEPLDDLCFAALDQLAGRLQREGRRLTLVLAPVHPRWKAKEDPDGRLLKELRARIQHVLLDSNAVVWDGDAEWQPSEAAFTDAIHLRWSAVREFSKVVARQLPSGQAQPDREAGSTQR